MAGRPGSAAKLPTPSDAARLVRSAQLPLSRGTRSAAQRHPAPSLAEAPLPTWFPVGAPAHRTVTDRPARTEDPSTRRHPTLNFETRPGALSPLPALSSAAPRPPHPLPPGSSGRVLPQAPGSPREPAPRLPGLQGGLETKASAAAVPRPPGPSPRGQRRAPTGSRARSRRLAAPHPGLLAGAPATAAASAR